MNDEAESFRCQSGFSSPPCLASEVAPDYFDPLAVDPQQARDVARWRKAERTRLRAYRMALSVEQRQDVGDAVAGHLRQVLRERFYGARGMVFSAYWPIKGEPDLRPLMAVLHASGVNIALPVVESKAAPLVGWTAEGFRLGYGGGYFDRTLAALDPRPFAIGIGFDAARLETIYPQPHDIPVDLILTEAGILQPPARD